MGMDSSEMLIEVFEPREPLASGALAAFMRTMQRVFGPAVLAVYFALVTQKAAGVGESW